MATSESTTIDVAADVARWRDGLNELFGSIRDWAGSLGWRSRLARKHLVEKAVGRYEVPVLILDRGDAEISVVPVARQAPGAEGLVQFFRMPAYESVASLHREGGRWFVRRVPSPPPPPSTAGADAMAGRLSLDEEALRDLLDDLARSPHA
ncbi:hypothetical protein [Aquisphaera insulae]|uniref:hypothetical protein n=1 Tax=Aquisphaera insulae TaxID=2712864 RepID=UPI0013EBCDB6|nr:hypothetical protein [Aquisphaera insulae]